MNKKLTIKWNAKRTNQCVWGVICRILFFHQIQHMSVERHSLTVDMSILNLSRILQRINNVICPGNFFLIYYGHWTSTKTTQNHTWPELRNVFQSSGHGIALINHQSEDVFNRSFIFEIIFSIQFHFRMICSQFLSNYKSIKFNFYLCSLSIK